MDADTVVLVVGGGIVRTPLAMLPLEDKLTFVRRTGLAGQPVPQATPVAS